MTPSTTLSTTPALVLHAVATGHRYGFDVMDATGLPSGTVYPALRRLEDSGFVRSSWEPHARAERAKRPRRRYYEVTASGVTALEAARRRFPWLGAVGSTSATGAEPSKA